MFVVSNQFVFCCKAQKTLVSTNINSARLTFEMHVCGKLNQFIDLSGEKH